MSCSQRGGRGCTCHVVNVVGGAAGCWLHVVHMRRTKYHTALYLPINMLIRDIMWVWFYDMSELIMKFYKFTI